MKSLILAAGFAALSTLSAAAADLMAMEPFAFASTETAQAGAAYITLMSHGKADALVSAASPVAKRVEIHTHIEDDGVMKMREVEGPLAVAPDAPLKMEPGGIHVMLMGLNAPLVEGEPFPVTLTFESGEEMVVEVPVVARDTAAGHKHGHSHNN